MKILAVDVGTGTQDIFLYNSKIDPENGFKMVLPSPTMMVRRRLQRATQKREAVLLTGVTMGGGPSQWAAEDHLRAGLPVYATPDAARSFNDDLDQVQAMGIQVVSEDEAARLPQSIVRMNLGDFDFNLIRRATAEFGVELDDLAAVAVAVFDHGAAPPDVSDRKFRFDYLDSRIRTANRLSAFAYLSNEIPPFLTRMQAVAKSAADLPFPLVVMDTAPAAVLGATFDPAVAARQRNLIVNVGNFHTLAFRLGHAGIEGVFEHHTGFLNQEKLENLLQRLADGSLTNAQVFADQGHGALVYSAEPYPMQHRNFNLVVTGPRRNLLKQSPGVYFAVPFGDMMIAGCFGLLAAVADLIPNLRLPIEASLSGRGGSGTAPWDAD